MTATVSAAAFTAAGNWSAALLNNADRADDGWLYCSLNRFGGNPSPG
jgi:hypothetical protein